MKQCVIPGGGHTVAMSHKVQNARVLDSDSGGRP